jgi:hypothetical protein
VFKKTPVMNTVTVRIKGFIRFSTHYLTTCTTVLRLKDSVILEISTPLVSFDKEKMMVTDKIHSPVHLSPLHKERTQQYYFFLTKEEQTYT